MSGARDATRAAGLGWRPALRIARRSVRQHLGRSLLIIALLALPVAGATLADGLVRSVTDLDVDVNRTMGTADAIALPNGRRAFDVEALLPPGSRAVPMSSTEVTGSLRLTVGDRIVRSRLDLVVLGDPLTAHQARLASGRLPGSPAETLVTEPLAERLGLLDGDGDLRPGTTVLASGGTTATVTGLAVKPYCLSCADVVAMPDSVLKKAMLDGPGIPSGYLIDLPAGVDPAEVARNWRSDESHVSIPAFFEERTPFSRFLSDGTGAPLMIFAGLGLLAIVITAGAAFAVGARTQVHELGLVAVNGGTAGHVRRIVLAQGLVLGVLGAATGLLVGAAATVLGLPLWERLANQLIEDLRFGWVELVIVAAVGVLASVVAATVPAFFVARMRPIDALTGRFRVPPAARRPLLGTLLTLAGLATVIAAGVVGRGQITEYDELTAQFGYTPLLGRTLPAVGAFAGFVVAVVGLVLVMPALLTAAGRLGDRLPSSGRLAIRDAVRHRHRTVAAGAAIMITVAGSIVAAFVFTAQSVPRTLPANTALVLLDDVAMSNQAANGAQQLEHAKTDTTRSVFGAEARDVTLVGAGPSPDSAAITVESGSSLPRCYRTAGTLGAGTPATIELSMGRKPDARVLSALADGKVVVFDECLVNKDGMVSLYGFESGPTFVPAYLAAAAPGSEDYIWHLPTGFISPEAAAAHGWKLYTDSVAITYLSPADLDIIRGVVEDAGLDLYVGVSTNDTVTGLYLALAALAGLVALLGAGATVALSATDGRADLATLAALGAPPRRRRRLAGAQALVVTSLGTLGGLVLGACAGFAAVPLAGLRELSVPWEHLLLTTLAVPLLAAVLAVLVTPSRLVPRS